MGDSMSGPENDPPAAGERPAPGRASRTRPGASRPSGLWPPQPRSRRIAGGAGYFLNCVLALTVLVASGFAYVVVNEVRSIGGSNAIVSGPSIGTQNILLMGVESRRYWNGDILPSSILDKLHAGSAAAVASGVGGNDTNTLILIHIPAGGKRAVGFSIPRDDWVQFADTVGPQQSGKIDQAYGVSLYFREQQIKAQDPHISQDRLAFLGNEAGQAAAVATVEKLTGVHIDHFAAVNLYGFYELAKVLGGVEVCLKHAVHDKNSGANFHAGYQHLDASQALAFVRQRDGLPNGDLDRTHRQQAFIDSVIHQLNADGVLNDLTKVQDLLSVAKQYVITDSGWDLLRFSAQMSSLTSSHLVFRTLPIEGYQTIDGQDANVVNPAYIKQIVHAEFYESQAATPRAGHHSQAAHAKTTVDVLNGGQTSGLAKRISAALVRDGYSAGKVGDTSTRPGTSIRYGAGVAASARKIAAMFGVTAVASTSVRAGHVEVLLGTVTTMPASLQAASAAGSPSRPAHPSPSVVIPSSGPQGGAVSANNGIPCVN
jgi:LCP family protein required for cell wall assembly